VSIACIVMKTKIIFIIAVIVGALCVAFAAFEYWQAFAVIAVVGLPVQINEKFIWWPLCAAAVSWAFAGYGFISQWKRRIGTARILRGNK